MHAKFLNSSASSSVSVFSVDSTRANSWDKLTNPCLYFSDWSLRSKISLIIQFTNLANPTAWKLEILKMHKMRHRQNVYPSSMWRALPVLSKFHTVLMMVICASGLLTACGPGTVGTQTRKNKAPMQLRQSLPRDVPETSLAASGQYIARVRRGSEAYKALKLNFNTNIVFKVDEKSDSDERRMTKVLRSLVVAC